MWVLGFGSYRRDRDDLSTQGCRYEHKGHSEGWLMVSEIYLGLYLEIGSELTSNSYFVPFENYP